MQMKAIEEKHQKLSNFAESAQGQGKYWFTKVDAIKNLKITDSAFNKATYRLIQQRKIMRIRNGFYVIIPPEFRQSTGLPPTHFIDALMKFSKQPYYIGILSAASLHGASHQSPQELQVVTSKPMRLIEVEQTRIRFITKKDIESTPVQKMKTPTGFVNVSTSAATVLDLLRYVRIAGHLDNVTTAIVELVENINATELLKNAKQEKDLSCVQRLGFLIDKFSKNKIVSRELNEFIKNKKPSFIFLRPDKRKDIIEKNQKWNILVNTNVEPDL